MLPSSQPSSRPSSAPTEAADISLSGVHFKSYFAVFVHQCQVRQWVDACEAADSNSWDATLILGKTGLFNGSVVKLDAFLLGAPALAYDHSGRSVSVLSDVNGDGYDDLIIGVPYAARVYVLFGTHFGLVNMTEGFTIYGAATE